MKIKTEYVTRLARISEQSGMVLAEVHEIFDERAAVREYQGNMKRAEAERAALDDTESMLLPRVKPTPQTLTSPVGMPTRPEKKWSERTADDAEELIMDRYK